jgi:hypothetical protein
MFFIKILPVKLAILMFSCSLFPTVSVGIEREKAQALTGQQMVSYAEDLLKLCRKGSYEEAWKKAFPEPQIVAQNPIRESERERYECYRFNSLSMIYLNRGERLELQDPKAAMQHYQESFSSINSYLLKWSNFVPNASSAEYMVTSRAFALQQKSAAASRLAHLMIKRGMSLEQKEEAQKWLRLSIEGREQMGIHIQSMANMNADLAPQKGEDLVLQSDLFNEYHALLGLCEGQEKESCRKKMEKIYEDVRRQSQKNPVATPYLKKMSLTLQMLKKADVKEGLLEKSKREGKITDPKEEIVRRLDREIADIISGLDDSNEEEDLSTDSIVISHQKFCALAREDLESADIVPLLKRIEEKIRNQLVRLGQPSTLQDVYRAYANAVTKAALVKDMPFGLKPFLLVGDVEAALERINILSDLERELHQNNSKLIRLLRAAIKNMNGDYEEWLALEKEIAQFHDKKKEKKKRQKKKQRENYVKAAMQSQEEWQKQQESQVARVDINQSLPLSQPVAGVRDESAGLDISVPSSPLPAQEAKEAKIERHKEAQKRREEERQKPSSSSSSSSSPNPAKGKEEAKTKPLSAIGQTFSLTGVAKDVEEQIQSGSWRFSRENAMAYFEALGCTAKEGGKHKKVELPQAIMVSHNDKLLTIINDLGGALTLPRWDGREGGGTVPHYLRKQILKAREKLLL